MRSLVHSEHLTLPNVMNSQMLEAAAAPPLTPLQRYQQDVANGSLFADAAQAQAILHFERVYAALLERRSAPTNSMARLFSLFKRANAPRDVVKGLYIYGGVGRGKTYLMDVFFESLPFPDKMRTHFHRFMQQVHSELAQLKQQKNPLEQVAKRIAAQTRIICFDEFFVSDIGDAMILGGLLTALIEEGVSFVTTSNIEPDLLYANGLQRERFLPVIALLKQHTTVVHLDGGLDYRLRSLEQAQLYYSPLGAHADAALNEGFQRLADHGRVDSDTSVEVLGRLIPAKMAAQEIIWFDCAVLCGDGRGAYDYIELAKLYFAIVLSNVPLFDGSNDDQARRFVSLIDELYDRHVKLLMSAQVPLSLLYQGSALSFIFERTVSRLLEMQSHEYLAREHRP